MCIHVIKKKKKQFHVNRNSATKQWKYVFLKVFGSKYVKPSYATGNMVRVLTSLEDHNYDS